MKTCFIIININEKFESILKYSKFVNKDNEKYFIICANDITNEIKECFSGGNCTFFRNTLPSESLNSNSYNSFDSNANSIYSSILFASKILEKDYDYSSNIIILSKIQNNDNIFSFKYLFNNYKNIKYLYTRY